MGLRNSRSCTIMGSHGSCYVFTGSVAPLATWLEAILIRWSILIFNISWFMLGFYNDGVPGTKMGFSCLLVVCRGIGYHLAPFILRSTGFSRKTISRRIW